jgi:hypothetical protein
MREGLAAIGEDALMLARSRAVWVAFTTTLSLEHAAR